jgi:hypothetical protein
VAIADSAVIDGGNSMATCELKSFDVQARGVAAVAEEWQSERDDTRSVWTVDEVTDALKDCLRNAKQIYDEFRLGKLHDAGPFAHYVATFRLIVQAGRQFRESALQESQSELSRLLDEVQEIVDEDDVAQSLHHFEDWN